MRTGDIHPTSYIRKGRVFGDITVRYTHNRKLDSLKSSLEGKTTVIQDGASISEWSASPDTNSALRLSQSFALQKDAIPYEITSQSATTSPSTAETFSSASGFSVTITRVPATENRIIIEFVDKNNVPFNPKGGTVNRQGRQAYLREIQSLLPGGKNRYSSIVSIPG